MAASPFYWSPPLDIDNFVFFSIVCLFVFFSKYLKNQQRNVAASSPFPWSLPLPQLLVGKSDLRPVFNFFQPSTILEKGYFQEARILTSDYGGTFVRCWRNRNLQFGWQRSTIGSLSKLKAFQFFEGVNLKMSRHILWSGNNDNFHELVFCIDPDGN